MIGSFKSGWDTVARLFRPRLRQSPVEGFGVMAGEHVSLDVEAAAAKRLSEELSRLQDALILKPFGMLKADMASASDDRRVGGSHVD